MTRLALSDAVILPDKAWIGIVVSKTNDFVTERMLSGAQARLQSAGVESTVVLDVAGSFELIAGARGLLDAGAAGVVALGAIIRGQTPHFDYISQAVAVGLGGLAAEGHAVSFGVLTCDTVSQATERAGGALGNKGEEAAEALLQLLSGRSRLRDVLDKS